MILPKQTQAVAEHYDVLDPFYRSLWGEHVHHGYWTTGKESPDQAVQQLVELAASEAKLRSGMQVCDIGCGYGATARLLARQWGAHVTALTVSSAQHQYALSLQGEDLTPVYLLQNWIGNDLPANAFDAAIAIESSEHMEKKAFFKEAHRVLKPNGRLVIFAWLSKSNPNSFEKGYLLDPICVEGQLHGLGTSDIYRNLMQSAGFSAIDYKDLTQNVKKTWSICAYRVLRAFFTDPKARQFVRSNSHHCSFINTIFRIRLAYALGTMKYGLFTATKKT